LPLGLFGSALGCVESSREHDMAQTMSGEVQDLLAKFVAENPQYRQALIADPNAIIEKRLNTPLGTVRMPSVVETAGVACVIVPDVIPPG